MTERESVEWECCAALDAMQRIRGHVHIVTSTLLCHTRVGRCACVRVCVCVCTHVCGGHGCVGICVCILVAGRNRCVWCGAVRLRLRLRLRCGVCRCQQDEDQSIISVFENCIRLRLMTSHVFTITYQPFLIPMAIQTAFQQTSDATYVKNQS